MSRNSKLTPAGFELLVRLVDDAKSFDAAGYHAKGGVFVRGSEVLTARRLMAAGFASLEDNGAAGDAERWWVVVTHEGMAELSAIRDVIDHSAPASKGGA